MQNLATKTIVNPKNLIDFMLALLSRFYNSYSSSFILEALNNTPVIRKLKEAQTAFSKKTNLKWQQV
jgi:hypothetical protein